MVLADSVSGESPLPHWWPSSHCNLTWLKRQGISPGSLLYRHESLCPHDLITLRRPYLQVPSHWGWGFNIYILAGGAKLQCIAVFSHIMSLNMFNTLWASVVARLHVTNRGSREIKQIKRADLAQGSRSFHCQCKWCNGKEHGLWNHF